MTRAIERAGGVVDVMRTIDDARNGWLGHDLLVVQAGAKDSSLRRFVKWARLSESAPFVVAVGDGLHDPRWLEDGKKGAQASVLAPDDVLAGHALHAARAWMAARDSSQRGVDVLPAADVPERRVSLPDWLPFLLDKTAAAMAVFDSGLRYRLCNRSWRELFGLHDADVTGRHFSDGFAGLSEGWREAYRRALAGESLKRDEDTVVTASGVAMQVRWEIAPWRDGAGAIGGVIAIFEPRPRSQASAEQFEIALGRSMLGAQGAWLVVQDPQGVILGSSKGISTAIGRTGRMFGRSYWEACKVETTTCPPDAFAAAMRQWRQTGEFAFPPKIVETMRGPGGMFEITWSVVPYFLDDGVSSGVIRSGTPKRLDGAPQWDLPWDADDPALLWEAGKNGIFVRIGRGFRQFVGWDDGEDHPMDAFGRLVTITPTWFLGIQTCLNGGKAVDAVLQVRTKDGVVPVRFIGMRDGDAVVRGWAVTMTGAVPAPSPASPPALAAPAPAPAVATTSFAIVECTPAIIFILDARGRIVHANASHRAMAVNPARAGEEFTAWLADAAGVAPHGVEAWREFGWRKQTPCTLTLTSHPRGARQIEFVTTAVGDGHVVVTARDVTADARPRYFVKPPEPAPAR